jgi:YgiT-type zinc finger domain-containing protein
MDTNMPEVPKQTQGACPECQTGILRLQYLTYFTWLNGELISVPNFPAWVCDVCGMREYDGRAVNWLNTLLSPDTGRRSHSPRRRSPAHTDQPFKVNNRTINPKSKI